MEAMVTFKRWVNGFSVEVLGRHWDYWPPGSWVPLSARGNQHWWGTVRCERVTEEV